MNTYQETISSLKAKWGDKFNEPVTNPAQVRYFNGPRVEVTSDTGYVRRGRIGITTGWSPVLLLMHTRRAVGSWDTLKASDKITALIDSRGRRQAVSEA